MIESFQTTKKERQRVPLILRLLATNHNQEIIQRPNGLGLHQLFYCIEGKGELTIRGQLYHIVPGDVFLIHAYEGHRYQSRTKEWLVDIIGFEGNICDSLLETLGISESGVYHIANPAIIRDSIEKIYAATQTEGKYKKLIYSSLIYDTLIQLSTVLSKVDGTVATPDNVLVSSMIDYMECNYQNPITLDDISAYVGKTSEYLCGLFKHETGMTIISYLTVLRINQARIFLVQYPEKKASEIGAMCGFQSSSYFGKIFKQYCDVSPSAYRLAQLR